MLNVQQLSTDSTNIIVNYEGDWFVFVNSTFLLNFKISPEAKLLFLVLKMHASLKTGKCYPSQNLLMKETGFGKGRFLKAIKELKNINLLTTERVRNKSGNSYSHTLYTLKNENNIQIDNDN